jgi:hypothetical protein
VVYGGDKFLQIHRRARLFFSAEDGMPPPGGVRSSDSLHITQMGTLYRRYVTSLFKATESCVVVGHPDVALRTQLMLLICQIWGLTAIAIGCEGSHFSRSSVV